MSFAFSTWDLQSSLESLPSPPPKMIISTRGQASPKTPKLRASCDCCAASKVRCSQEHPTCARCKSNDTVCIYGVSRKMGRPGRGRKRVRDADPTASSPERASSVDGRQTSSYRLSAEPLLPDVPDFDMPELGTPEFDLPSWPSTPEWPATPEYQDDESMPDIYPSDSCSTMDDILPPEAFDLAENETVIEPELVFTNPFAKKGGLNLDLSLPPGFSALKSFVDGNDGNGSYTLVDRPNDFFIPMETPPQSPKGSGSYFEAF